jgi:hypothetical protein
MVDGWFLALVLVAAAGIAATVFAVRQMLPARERREQRRAARVDPPPDSALLSIAGVAYPLKNWSAGGFLAEAPGLAIAVGQRCIVNIQVRQNPFEIGFAAEVEIVRKSEGEVAGRFVFLSPDNKEQIEAYFTYFGQMR